MCYTAHCSLTFKVLPVHSPLYCPLAFVLRCVTTTKISQQVGIVISNLVIGLTVNEAEEVFKTALSMRLERAMSQILGIEGLLLTDSALTRALHARFRKSLEERTQMRRYLNSGNVGGKVSTHRQVYSHEPKDMTHFGSLSELCIVFCFRYDTASGRPSRIQPLKFEQIPSIFG